MTGLILFQMNKRSFFVIFTLVLLCHLISEKTTFVQKIDLYDREH